LAGGLLLAVLAAAGCSKDQLVMQSGLPGARASASLAFAGERGDYLDVVMESGGLRYRFFLPNDDACRALFADEQAVTYAHTGPFGRLQSGETTCDPIGILSLAEWRDRRSRPMTRSPIPRSRVELRERVYVDEELALIRGRYPLAGAIGFAGAGDAIAVVPNVAECEHLPVPGTATMEFRPAGKQAYSLINAKQLCPILGFVKPPATPAP
jgi:hypothetical protein